MRSDPCWSAERVALLRSLWTVGATADTIASALGGVSRSAVLGKVFRLRLGASGATAAAASRGDTSSPLSPASPQGSGEPPDPGASLETAAPLRRRRGRRAEFAQNARTASARRGKSLLELTNECCRWVVEAGVKWVMGVVFSHIH